MFLVFKCYGKVSKVWSRSVMPCISEAVGAVRVLVLIGCRDRCVLGENECC